MGAIPHPDFGVSLPPHASRGAAKAGPIWNRRSRPVLSLRSIFCLGERAMRVGLLTGGGDCPGLNAVIHAVVKKGINQYGDEFIGFLEGWRGVLDNNTVALTLEKVDGILDEGGTILCTSRTNVRKIQGGI